MKAESYFQLREIGEALVNYAIDFDGIDICECSSYTEYRIIINKEEIKKDD